MTRTIWTGALASIVIGAAVAALAQAAAPQQSTSPSADQRITVTGCLREVSTTGIDTAATAATTGSTTTGTPASSAAGAAAPANSADEKFVLADATMSPASSEAGSATGTTVGTTGTAGTNGTSSAAGTKQTYQLIANPSALRPHVGHKLELTGTLVNQSASTSTAATPGMSAGPSLKVESGKVIAASCQE